MCEQELLIIFQTREVAALKFVKFIQHFTEHFIRIHAGITMKPC